MDQPKMNELKINDIPKIYHGSTLFRELKQIATDNELDYISIPFNAPYITDKYLVELSSFTIWNDKDFIKSYEIINYWMFDELPSDFIEYLCYNENMPNEKCKFINRNKLLNSLTGYAFKRELELLRYESLCTINNVNNTLFIKMIQLNHNLIKPIICSIKRTNLEYLIAYLISTNNIKILFTKYMIIARKRTGAHIDWELLFRFENVCKHKNINCSSLCFNDDICDEIKNIVDINAFVNDPLDALDFIFITSSVNIIYAFYWAINGDHEECFKYIHRRLDLNEFDKEDVLKFILINDSSKYLKLIYDHIGKTNHEILYMCIVNYSYDCIKYLRSIDTPWGLSFKKCLDNAYYARDQIYHNENMNTEKEFTMFKFLCDNNVPRVSEQLIFAFGIEWAQYACDVLNIIPNQDAFDYIFNGELYCDFEVIKYLHETKNILFIPEHFQSYLCAISDHHNTYEMLKYIHENCEINETNEVNAICLLQNIDSAIYYNENIKPIKLDTFIDAAMKFDNVELLKYALRDTEISHDLLRSGCPDCCQYILDNA